MNLINDGIKKQILYLSKKNNIENIRLKLKNVMSKYRHPPESVKLLIKYNIFLCTILSKF